MRAEDLFEAMGGLDEELIARSERKVRSNTKKKSKNRKARSTIYRFAVVTMTTAAAVFLFLMARDLIGTSKADSAGSTQAITRAFTEENGSGEDAILVQGAAEDAAADTLNDGEPMPEAEASPEAGNKTVMESDAGNKAAKEAQAEAAEEAVEAETETAGDSGKTAVDLLGSQKGDYVSLEYISAADEAAGGSRIVPEYTEEGEAILSKAFSGGKTTPVFLAKVGEPVYYVYLTKENGEVHKATFYENAYVGMSNIPGVVMEISKEEYEDIMELFH